MDNEEESKALYEKRLQALQQEMAKKSLLRRMLSDGAYERMMNVRISNPELYDKVVSSLAYAAQSGRPMDEIDDGALYKLLQKLTQKRDTSIEFRSK